MNSDLVLHIPASIDDYQAGHQAFYFLATMVDN